MRKTFLAALMVACLALAVPMSAVTVNFDAQAAGHSNVFTGSLDSPLTIGIATFTGGQLLINEFSSVDLTGVYASTNLVVGPYTDPITITFSAPVTGFSIDVTNEIADNFTVADNLGGSSSAALGLNDTHTFTLSDNGITSVTITEAGANGQWDFAIDNVTWRSAVPEPGSMVLFGSGLVGLAGMLRRKLGR